MSAAYESKSFNEMCDLADKLKAMNAELAEVASRFSAAAFYLLDTVMEIDLDETEFRFEADGKEIANINFGELKCELDSALAKNKGATE